MANTTKTTAGFGRTKARPRHVSFECDDEIFEQIHAVMARFQITRSEVIRQSLRWSFAQLAAEDARGEAANGATRTDSK